MDNGLIISAARIMTVVVVFLFCIGSVLRLLVMDYDFKALTVIAMQSIDLLNDHN